MKGRSLLWLRRVAAICVLAAFALLFTVPTQTFSTHAALLAKAQIAPAILAGSLAILCILGFLSYIFGRLYCSLLCPLGLAQDAISLLRRKRKFRPLRRHNWLRYGIFAFFAGTLAFGLLLPAGLLDPYSAFGRIMTDLFAPLLEASRNLLAWAGQKLDLATFTAREINFPGWAAWLIAFATFLLIFILALKAGRIWCNYCPIGTGLGFLAQKSPFRIRLTREKCIACHRCEKVCKTGCIDIENYAVDGSRCVTCFRCSAVCPKEAIAYQLPGHSPASIPARDKRAFLNSLLALTAFFLLPAPCHAARGEEINRPDVIPQRRKLRSRAIPITPPGSHSLEHFEKHCTGCQLCVSACPNKVLVAGASGQGVLQPGLTYEYGYCRPNCVLCSEVCPAGAIGPVSVADKKTIQIGHASVDFNRCIIHTDQIQCTACQRICPSEAISLEPIKPAHGELRHPVVNVNQCSGCGACEYICPAMPLAAIAVSGNKIHAKI